MGAGVGRRRFRRHGRCRWHGRFRRRGRPRWHGAARVAVRRGRHPVRGRGLGAAAGRLLQGRGQEQEGAGHGEELGEVGAVDRIRGRLVFYSCFTGLFLFFFFA